MRKDLTGQTFGKLTVLEDAGRDNWHSVKWDIVTKNR